MFFRVDVVVLLLGVFWVDVVVGGDVAVRVFVDIP